MENYRIDKRWFIQDEPSLNVQERIMHHVHTQTRIKKWSILKRYKHWYKVVVLPVLGIFVLASVYIGYYRYTHTLQNEITQTKNAINNFVALSDYEIF